MRPLLLVFLLCGCPGPAHPTPLVSDAGDAPVACAAYCGHLRALKCMQAAPTRKGATCEQVCGAIEASGYVQNARACSMSAQTCAAVDVCEM